MRFDIAILALLCAMACSGKGDDSAGTEESDADTDSDTDTDSDADADTDTDTDTDTDADTDTDTDADSDTDATPADEKHPQANCDANIHDDWDLLADADYVVSYNELELESYYEADVDGDGFTDNTSTFTYDSSGNLTLDEEDLDGDGLVDLTIAQTFDKNGFLVRIETDRNVDGVAEATTDYTNDEDGNPLSAVVADEELSTEYWTYFYDGDVLLDYIEIDIGGDGGVDEYYEITWETAASGNVTYTQDHDLGNDGTIDDTYRIVRDPDERVLSFWQDTDGDGKPEVLGEYTLDKDGEIIAYHEELYGTKSGDYAYDLDYAGVDEWGRLVLVDGVADFVDFGEFILVRTYEWHCY